MRALNCLSTAVTVMVVINIIGLALLAYNYETVGHGLHPLAASIGVATLIGVRAWLSGLIKDHEEDSIEFPELDLDLL